jgi:hypothetical protein
LFRLRVRSFDAGAQVRELIAGGVIVDKSKYRQRQAWKLEQVRLGDWSIAFIHIASRTGDENSGRREVSNI